MSPTDRTLVVGAGMAGLTAAAELERNGVETVVVDKGRAPGGRMASRTIGPARFDHGAQHFSARSAPFRTRVDEWIEAGVVRAWFSSPSLTEPGRGTEPRHVGVGGMRTVPEHLAADLDVRTGVTVVSLAPTPSGLAATTSDGGAIGTAAVVLTPPVPQALTLLEGSDLDLPDATRSALTAVDYDATLAVMARLDGPSGLPDGHLTPDRGPIAWMADNQDKGTSAAPAVTVHSTAGFADAHLDADPERWVSQLVEEAGQYLDGAIVAARGHRWRYSQPRRTLDEGSVALPDAPIVLAGEAFAGARVEGAFLSGLAAAERVLGIA